MTAGNDTLPDVDEAKTESPASATVPGGQLAAPWGSSTIVPSEPKAAAVPRELSSSRTLSDAEVGKSSAHLEAARKVVTKAASLNDTSPGLDNLLAGIHSRPQVEPRRRAESAGSDAVAYGTIAEPVKIRTAEGRSRPTKPVVNTPVIELSSRSVPQGAAKLSAWDMKTMPGVLQRKRKGVRLSVASVLASILLALTLSLGAVAVFFARGDGADAIVSAPYASQLAAMSARSAAEDPLPLATGARAASALSSALLAPAATPSSSSSAVAQAIPSSPSTSASSIARGLASPASANSLVTTRGSATAPRPVRSSKPTSPLPTGSGTSMPKAAGPTEPAPKPQGDIFRSQ